MKVDKITVSGLDKLHKAYVTKMSDASFQYMNFGSRVPDFLNNIEISLGIMGINVLELIALKRMAKNVIIIKKSYANFLTEKDEAYPIVQNLLTLADEMYDDTDIDNTMDNVFNILPLGCEQYDVIATFKGIQVSLISGSFYQELFREDHNTPFPKMYPYKEINNLIVKKFLTNFYSNMIDFIEEMDRLTDVTMFKEYYGFIENESTKVAMSHISSPTGAVEFFNSDATTLNRQLTSLRRGQKLFTEIPSADFYYYFVLNSTIFTFANLLLYTDNVSGYMDIKNALSNTHVDISSAMMNKYKERINTLVSASFKYQNGLINDNNQAQNLLKYLLIIGGQKIRYMFFVGNKQDPHKLIVQSTAEYGIIKNDITNNMNAVRANLVQQ